MEYTYNSSGLLAKTEDKSNNTITTYEYDPYGNVTKIACASETDNGTALSVTDYTYDITGNLLTAQNESSVSSFIYDAAGRQVRSETDGAVSRTLYDSCGVLTTIYKNGEEAPDAYRVQKVHPIQKLPETYNQETKLHYLYDKENSKVSAYDLDPDDPYQWLHYLAPNDQKAELHDETENDAAELSGIYFGTSFSISSGGSQIKNTVGELSSTYTMETDENDVLVSDGITAGESVVLPAAYSYDEDGRITGSGSGSAISRYAYDDSDQLIRTDNSASGSASSYEYDSRGNMLSKKLYDYTTGALNGLTPKETTSFTYANSGWKDQLVAVNGTELTYDESGNLRAYGDKTYSWSHGTRLESIKDGEKEYSYVYDEGGIRFSKTVNGETTQFYYTGGLLPAQKTGDDVIFFQYGAGGIPLGFVYNGVQYFYITNQLGDVAGIADSQGELFVQYTYDEWGKPIETLTRYGTQEEKEIAEINPLRYRGYYYDSETGYYYLQSRYYNPEWGRFISPDSFGYIDNSTRMGFNAYVYCVNSPLMYVDYFGKSAIAIAGASLGQIIIYIIIAIFIVSAGIMSLGLLFLLIDSISTNSGANSSSGSSSSNNNDHNNKNILKKIPNSLKKGNKVDLSKFDTKLKNGQGYKAKNGWRIQKDTSGHGGSEWKLFDKSGNRIASLRGDGSIVGK